MADKPDKADKKKNKPRHQNLVVPGKGKNTGGLLAELPDPWQPAPEEPEAPVGNAIVMPTAKGKKKPRLSPARRRRLFRRVRRLALLVLAGAVVLFYITGAYLPVAAWVAESFDSIRIAAQGGGGFPMAFGQVQFLKAEPMGEGGMFVLGQSEAAIISSQGAQLRYLQHTYPQPGVATGNTRAVLYGRGGREYTVESRTKTLAHNTTGQEIQLCAISPGGNVGVVTAGRRRANLQVLGPPYNPADLMLDWSLVDETPVALAFHADNTSLALGCLSAKDGALGTTLFLLRCDHAEVQAQIRADAAVLLQLRYLEGRRLLAVYDTYTATYDSQGRELNRYDYAQRRLLTAGIHGGRVALVFGTTTGGDAHTVLLDLSLEPLFDVAAQTLAPPQVLAVPGGVYLRSGQVLHAYNSEGALVSRTEYEEKLYGLAYAGTPLLLNETGFIPIEDKLRGEALEGPPSLSDNKGEP